MLEKIENKTVVEKIVEQITKAIMSRELKSGDKIPTEVELIERFGVGRNSVREAIKILSAQGILEIKRGDGTYISQKISPSVFDSLAYSMILGQSSKDEILELRETLEIDILELAMEKADEKDIEDLSRIHMLFLESIENKYFEKAAEYDLQFHFALINMTKNQLFIRIAKTVLQLFFISIKTTIEKYQANQKGHISHEAMINILKTKDKSKIVEVVKQSHNGWKTFI